MKKIILRLCLMMAVALTLYACRNEDLLQQEQAANKRNNAEFFKHAQGDGTSSRGGVDYVAILEAYERTHPFLTTMPDQQGMPIWEKMQVLDNENLTTLFIPLSADNETLTSILFVNLDLENNVSDIKNIDNDILKRIVYDTKHDAHEREGLLSLFMMVDKHTFGTVEFTNIPKDLYVGGTFTDYRRLRIENLEFNHTTHSERTIISICQVLFACKNNKTYAECDKCGTCLKKWGCKTIYLDEGDGTFPFPEPGPFYPGGAGGGGVPGPMPPKDPCTYSQTVFYRMVPGCGSGGPGDGGELLDTPCANIISENIKAKNFLNNSVIKAKDSTMKVGIASATVEKGFIFGKDSNGVYKTSEIYLGTSSSQVDLPPTHPDFTAEGGFHNHTNDVYEVSSPGDVYWFMQNNYTNNNFDYYYTNGALGSTYAYVITNQADFDQFPLSYPPSQYFTTDNNGWKPNSTIGIDYDYVLQYFKKSGKTDEESNELAQAYVIGKYSMGMGLSKKDSNGNFQPIFVKEIVSQVPVGDPFNPFSYITIKSYQKTSDCNLK